MFIERPMALAKRTAFFNSRKGGLAGLIPLDGDGPANTHIQQGFWFRNDARHPIWRALKKAQPLFF